MNNGWRKLWNYCWPEMINSFLWIFLPLFLDFFWIFTSKNPAWREIFCIIANPIHLLIKITEGLAIEVTRQVGFYNGAQQLEAANKALLNGFAAAAILSLLMLGGTTTLAYPYFRWSGLSKTLYPLAWKLFILHGVALSCALFYMVMVGYCWGHKNTATPLKANFLGLLGWSLIELGIIFNIQPMANLGLLAMGYANLLRYCAMLIFILWQNQDTLLGLSLTNMFNYHTTKQLLINSLYVISDKAIFALSFIWLYKILKPYGTEALLFAEMIKQLSRFAIIPALAASQVTTFLSSNYQGAKITSIWQAFLTKILVITSLSISLLLIILNLNFIYLAIFFKLSLQLNPAAPKIFLLLSSLVLFDGAQAVLAGCLRGCNAISFVMQQRLWTMGIIFPIISWSLGKTQPHNNLGFSLIYSSIYIAITWMAYKFIVQINALNLEPASPKITIIPAQRLFLLNNVTEKEYHKNHASSKTTESRLIKKASK